MNKMKLMSEGCRKTSSSLVYITYIITYNEGE